MATDTLVASFAEPAELAGSLSRRIALYFKVHVEDWCDVCRCSVAWEDHHFADNLSPEALAGHGALLDELERTGRFFQQAMETANFSDQATADLVAMTLQDLKDRRALWHGRLKSPQRAAILRDVFHES
jgi:hypothetical protein